jgi:hypothetical protein
MAEKRKYSYSNENISNDDAEKCVSTDNLSENISSEFICSRNS